jgi:hypothetical protein
MFSSFYSVDLETVLNSILSLIIETSADKSSRLVTTFCESIVKVQLPERFGLVKLRVFSNLFHCLIATLKIVTLFIYKEVKI